MLEWWNFPNTGFWYDGKWEGPKQVENKSPENVKACYKFLASRPYTSEEDRKRIEEEGLIREVEAALDR